MFRKIFTIISITLLVASVTMAQSGRIMGKVVDQQSGEPLIGANVLVVGTNFGAATDVNGNFIITQVSPGEYSVKASYIGYQDVIVRNIRVLAGLTAEVDFKLPSTAIATKEVVIVSQRPLIEKSATNAVRIVSSEDLQALPVRSLNAYVGLQAGVVRQDGNTYIRGSRPDETGYILEGANIKDIYGRNGGSLVTVTPDALQEIQVQAGGYTAEYGNANAGIIQESFKTGTDQYHFSLRGETDNFGNYPGKKFMGTYSYGYSDYVATASGPLLTKNLKFFVSLENNFFRDNNPMFFYGNPSMYADGALWDTTHVYDNGISGGSTSDSRILTWDAGNIPGQMTNRYTVNGTALYDLKPLLIRLTGAYTWYHMRTNNNDIRNLFDLERLSTRNEDNLLLNLKATYFLTSSSYLEANINYYDRQRIIEDPYFKDNVLAYSDSLQAAQYGWNFVSYTSGPNAYNFYGFPFSRPGAVLSTYQKLHWSYMGGSIAYTNQFGIHELKAGASYQRWTMRSYIDAGFGGILNAIRLNPDLARNTGQLADLIVQNSGANLENYGYDIFGNETNQGLYAPKHPDFGSAYIQDRIEISDLIINAGVRFDYMNMDSWSITQPDNPSYNKTNWTIPDSSIGTTPAYRYVSPRLGFSFPVTDRTVFHMQYGKFVQAPALQQAFQGITYAAHVIQGGTAFVTPVAYDIHPIRTTQYEIGFTQQFTSFAAFDVTAFYKDIKGQLQYKLQSTISGSLSQPYPVLVNQDFATTKGLELSLKIRRIARLRAEINYTYSDARGTNSGSLSGFGAQQTGNPTPSVIVPLTFDQTHRGTIMLDYRFAQDDGGPILQRAGLNLLFTFNSGHPYTLDQTVGLGQNSAWTGGILSSGAGGDSRANKPVEPINSSQTPWNYNIDLRIDKEVTIMNTDFDFYVYVQNLLNTKNVVNVYYTTGNAYNDGFLQSSDAQKIMAQAAYSQRFADLYNAINIANRQNTLAVNINDLFGPPRELRAGVLINF